MDSRVTGMPVVDEEGVVVGVVSDYDLLCLDSVSHLQRKQALMGGGGQGLLFPAVDEDWTAFRKIQHLVEKSSRKTVGEVMTGDVTTVREHTDLDAAAMLLLEQKFPRLPVIDQEGRLVGVLTRGGLVRAAVRDNRARNAAGR